MNLRYCTVNYNRLGYTLTRIRLWWGVEWFLWLLEVCPGVSGQESGGGGGGREDGRGGGWLAVPAVLIQLQQVQLQHKTTYSELGWCWQKIRRIHFYLYSTVHIIWEIGLKGIVSWEWGGLQMIHWVDYSFFIYLRRFLFLSTFFIKKLHTGTV